MLGSDDREEELEADEAVWERLRARASVQSEVESASSDESGSDSYGEEPTGAFDRHDPAIASAFEQDDYEEPSAIAQTSASYELDEEDLESDDYDDDQEGDRDEDGASFDGAADDADDAMLEEYDAAAPSGQSEDDEELDEEDEEALWAQARASLELAHREEALAREQAANYAAQQAPYAFDDGQAGYPQQEYAQQEYAQQEYAQQEYAQQEYAQQEYAQQGYVQQSDEAGAYAGYEQYDDGATQDDGQGVQEAYQRPSHVSAYGQADDPFGQRHSAVGLVAGHEQAYPGEQQGFGEASYAQAASTGFPPAQAPGAFNQQAWAENFDVPDTASAPTRRGGRLLKGFLGAALVAAAAGAGAYQFVLLPQQERARAAELAALEAQQQKVIEQERVAKEAAARAEAEQRAAAEAALKRAEEAAAAAGGAAEDVKTAEPEAAKPRGRAKAAEEGESRAERKARERAERKERREAARAARAEKRERKAAKASADDSEAESKSARKSKKAEKADKAESQAAAEAENDDPLFGL